MQLTFGSGEVFVEMITDAYGNRVLNATPVRIMGLQEMSVDLSAELKSSTAKTALRWLLLKARSKFQANLKAL